MEVAPRFHIASMICSSSLVSRGSAIFFSAPTRVCLSTTLVCNLQIILMMVMRGGVARRSRLSGNFQLLDQDLGVPPALIVFLATAQWQVVGRTFDKSALRLEVGEC